MSVVYPFNVAVDTFADCISSHFSQYSATVGCCRRKIISSTSRRASNAFHTIPRRWQHTSSPACHPASQNPGSVIWDSFSHKQFRTAEPPFFFLAIFDLPFLITCRFSVSTLSFYQKVQNLIKDTAYVKQRARHPLPRSLLHFLFYCFALCSYSIPIEQNALPIVLTSSSGLLYLTFA